MENVDELRIVEQIHMHVHVTLVHISYAYRLCKDTTLYAVILMQVNQQHLVSVDRPVPQPDVVMESSVEHQMWPEGMEDEPPVLA